MGGSRHFKVYFFSMLVLVLFSFAFTAWDFLKTPTVSISSSLDLPYAEASYAKVTSNGLQINVSLFGASAFQPTSGSATIVETGQSCSLTVVGRYLYGDFPLSPSYLGLKDAGVEGVILGTFFGQLAQIHFFSIVPLDFSVSVNVTGVLLSGGLLRVNISSSSPIPLRFNGFSGVSLVDDSTHLYILNSVGFWDQPISVPAGNHDVTAVFRAGTPGVTTWLYSEGPLAPGNYTLYMPTSITYIYPTANITKWVQLYYHFEVT
ncbi:MAG: hypothetical protein ACP5T2_06260 [Thermoprotei archaeon]